MQELPLQRQGCFIEAISKVVQQSQDDSVTLPTV
jgi:hypothetical protein